MSMPLSDAQLIFEWKRAKAKLDAAKEMEMKLRMRVALQIFPDAEKGTNRAQGVKLVVRNAYSLADRDTVTEFLMSNKDRFAGTVIDWSYKFSEGGYNKLTLPEQQMLAPVLTIKPATPTLEAE